MDSDPRLYTIADQSQSLDTPVPAASDGSDISDIDDEELLEHPDGTTPSPSATPPKMAVPQVSDIFTSTREGGGEEAVLRDRVEELSVQLQQTIEKLSAIGANVSSSAAIIVT